MSFSKQKYTNIIFKLVILVIFLVSVFHGCAHRYNSDVRWGKIEGQYKKTGSIDLLIAALREKDWNIREKAAETLYKINDPRAVEPLIVGLGDSDEFVQYVVAKALCNIGDKKAFEPLVATIKNSDNIDFLKEGSECLWKMRGKDAIAILTENLKEEKEDVQARIVFVLGNIGPLAKDAIPTLIELPPVMKLLAYRTSAYKILPNNALSKIGSHSTTLEMPPMTPEVQRRIIQEKIEDRMRGGPGISMTEAGMVFDALGRAIVGRITKKRLEKRLEKQNKEKIKENEIAELTLNYGRYFKIKDVSFDKNTSGDTVWFTAVTTFTLHAGSYALNKITGEDFGEDHAKWQEWWEKNKSKYCGK